MNKRGMTGVFLAAGAAVLVSGCVPGVFQAKNAYSASEQAEVASISEEISQYRENESREALAAGQTKGETQNQQSEISETPPGTGAGNESGGSGVDMIIFDQIQEGNEYTDKESVAYYIHTYGSLPPNYITKTQARKMGWHQGLNLWDYAWGKSIGGGIYNDASGALPAASGRIWYECDIDYQGGDRGRKRLLYSNDGLIYYTEDNENFEQLY